MNPESSHQIFSFDHLNENLDNNTLDLPLTPVNNNNCSEISPVEQYLPKGSKLPLSRHSHYNSINANEILNIATKDRTDQFRSMQRIPEELHVVVGDDPEGGHSWRPSNSTDSLGLDLFMPFPLPEAAPISSQQLQIPESPDAQSEEIFLPTVSDSNQNANLNHLAENFVKIDVRSHLRFQKAQLNNLRYEIINAERKCIEINEEIGKLNHSLKERIKSENALDIKRLTNENAELRLECQCLCMEVDFFVKGNAPLGEVDETFYHKNTTSQHSNETNQESESCSQTVEENSDEQQNSWECPQCTFANHPAIHSCEMCHMPRISRENPNSPFLPVPSNSCYCQDHLRGEATSS